MDYKDYEQLTAAIIRDFEQFKNAEISTNCRVKGVRQPGEYEIDILVRLRLEGLLDFAIIVECKQWNKKIDRPVVQKLIQTKDAISAQKAIIVSPIGFTSEAIDVAKANGVALWILTRESLFASAFSWGDPTHDKVGGKYFLLRHELDQCLLGNLDLNSFGQFHVFGDFLRPYVDDLDICYPHTGAKALANEIMLYAIADFDFLMTKFSLFKDVVENATGREINSSHEIYSLVHAIYTNDFDMFCNCIRRLQKIG